MAGRARSWAWLVVLVAAVVAAAPVLGSAASWVDSLGGARATDFNPEQATTDGAVAGTAAGVFADQTAASGMDQVHTGLTVAHEGRQRFGFPVTGQAWADYDRDGRLDLYLTDQVGPNTLYHGEERGRFSRSPVAGAVALPFDVSGGAIFADYDNDGWPDLFVAGYGRDTLFHNEAGRGFTDVTAPAGIGAGDDGHGMTASWADYDRDGFLDLYVATYGCQACDSPTLDQGSADRLYHNDGDGTFTDATASLPGDAGRSWGFVGGWLDYDDDGDSDLYLVNNVRGTAYLPANALYRNDGPGCGGWCFADVSRPSGAGVRMDGMGIAVGDFDGDRHLDLYATDTGWAHYPLTGPPTLLHNDGDGTFTDVSATSGADIEAVSWGTVPLDYDNDGRLDLYVSLGGDPERLGDQVRRNRLLHGRGDGTFADASATSGASPVIDSLGSATADYDGDGWTDVVVGNPGRGYQLFANTATAGSGSHRLAVRLTGGGPVNRDAVGARVYVTTPDGRTQVREVISGSSLGGGSDLALGIGLGAATSASLRVAWPDGTEQAFPDVPADVGWLLSYQGRPTATPLSPVQVAPAPTELAPTTPDARSGAWLVPGLALLAVLGLAGVALATRLRLSRLAVVLAASVGIGALAFQLLHVGEHLLQLGYWIMHPAEPPWTTPWGRTASDGLGMLAGHEHGGRAAGFEMLHFAGGVICLAGLVVLRRLLRDPAAPPVARRTARFAFWLEVVHVTEHLSLSVTSLTLHVPVGVSTLFGGAFQLPGAWATSIRLLFHFTMNLTVTTAALLALALWWRNRRRVTAAAPSSGRPAGPVGPRCEADPRGPPAVPSGSSPRAVATGVARGSPRAGRSSECTTNPANVLERTTRRRRHDIRWW